MLKKIKEIFYKVKYRNGYKIVRILCFRFKIKQDDACLHPINVDKKLILPVPDTCEVGKCSYCNADLFIATKKTKIGSFCSIGPRVVLGHGNHPTDMLSTSPFLYLDCLGYKYKETVSYNIFLEIDPITIGNDVWIGDGAFVKNGVKIGDGAIIGARAVVTKDVPPYAIVVGSPAKVLRYRFEDNVIQELLRLKWWELEDSVIRDIPYNNIGKAINYLKKVRK